MTRTPPVYTVRWSSQISRINNRLNPPTPAPNAASAASKSSPLNLYQYVAEQHKYTNIETQINSCSNNSNNYKNNNISNNNSNNSNCYYYGSSDIFKIENRIVYIIYNSNRDEIRLTKLILESKYIVLVVIWTWIWIYNFILFEP